MTMAKEDQYFKKMTETPVAKLIITLGIPTTISMLITNIYNLVDTAFVGHLGLSQQSAVGIVFTLQTIIQAFAFMLGHGSGTYVSKCLAQKDTKTSSVYVSTAFFVGLGIGIILTVLGLLFLEPFMLMLGSSDTNIQYSMEYGFWILLSCPFMIGSLIINNNLRYEGKALFAMIGLSAGGVLNILGDYLLINVVPWGVFGAGMSTGISQIISFSILLIFYMKTAQSKLKIKVVSKEAIVYLDIFKGGLPSLLRQGLASLSNGVLNNLVKPYGDAAVAAMTVVNRYSSFVMCVGLGIGQGFQPVSSFNYQVGKYNRIKKGLFFTMIFSILVVLLFASFGLIIPKTIMEWLQCEPEGIDVGIFPMRAASIGVLFLPVSITTNMLYQSIRKTTIASTLSILRSGAIFIPVLYILALCFGLTGIHIAQPIADALSAIMSVPFIIYFVTKVQENTENNEKI